MPWRFGHCALEEICRVRRVQSRDRVGRNVLQVAAREGEALRSRVLWGFSSLLLVFLFASWFLPYKPENQVRNYVGVVFFAMTVLLLRSEIWP